MLRLAVIGLGRMGRFYAHTLANLNDRVELLAVADPVSLARAAIQAELKVPRVLAEPAAVLAMAELDAVVIATPTSMHAALVIAAAGAGKAIFCEKPLALSLEQTHAALAAVDQAGVPLQVGFMRRFDPAYQQARAHIEAGRIGRPVTFKAIGRDPTCPPLEYADPAHSGGLVVDMAIHDFDLARWLMGSEVDRVSAEGTLLACPELKAVGDIDNAVINLHFSNGALGNVEVSRNARYGYDIRTEVLGSTGAVLVGGHSPSNPDAALLLEGTGSAEQLEPPHFIRRFATAYRAQIEHFVDCLEHDRVPAVGGPDALAAFQIAHAANRSLKHGQIVSLADPQVPVQVHA